MDYDALMAFGVFAEYCNFTRAAKQLHISQPALHKKVNKLAEQVGVALYHKTGRALVLTPQGQMLATHARLVASMSDDVLARVLNVQQSEPMILAAGEGAFLHLLGPALRQARDHGLAMRLMPSRSDQAQAAVVEGRAHVAIGVFDSPPAMRLIPWRQVGQMLVVPRDHRLANKQMIHPRHLDGESLVIAPGDQPHHISTANVLDAHGVTWRVGVEVSGWALMVRFVSYGMGVAIINDFVPLPDDLVGIPTAGFPTIEYSALVHRQLSHVGARWFVETCL